MKKTVKQHDKYEPGTVILELSEAEYEALRGFVAAVAATAYRAAATCAERFASGSDYYWNMKLDWSRLFNEDK